MGLGRPAREGRQFPPAAVTADATCRSAANGGTLSSPGRNGSGERRLRLISPLSLPGAEPAAAPPDRLMPTDRDRFENLALPLLDTVYRTALHLAGGIAEAEDLTQETYLRAWRGFAGFRGDDPRSWLFAILRNAVVDRHRGDRLRLVPLDLDEEDAPHRLVAAPADAEPEPTVLAAAFDAPVARALASLPEAWRVALLLADVEGCSYREIAELTGSPMGTVMSRLSRARKALHERLDDPAGAACGAAEHGT